MRLRIEPIPGGGVRFYIGRLLCLERVPGERWPLWRGGALRDDVFKQRRAEFGFGEWHLVVFRYRALWHAGDASFDGTVFGYLRSRNAE